MVARRSRNGRENIKISRCGPCSLAGRRWEWSPPPARRKTTWWISRCWTYPCHPSRHPPISRSSLNDRGNSEGTTTRRHRCHVVAMPWNVRVRLSGVVHPLPRSCSLLVGDRDSSLPLCPLDKVGRWRRRIRKFVGDFQGSLKSRMDSRCFVGVESDGYWTAVYLFLFLSFRAIIACVYIYIYMYRRIVIVKTRLLETLIRFLFRSIRVSWHVTAILSLSFRTETLERDVIRV